MLAVGEEGAKRKKEDLKRKAERGRKAPTNAVDEETQKAILDGRARAGGWEAREEGSEGRIRKRCLIDMCAIGQSVFVMKARKKNAYGPDVRLSRKGDRMEGERGWGER